VVHVGGLKLKEVEEGRVVDGERWPRLGDARGIGGRRCERGDCGRDFDWRQKKGEVCKHCTWKRNIRAEAEAGGSYHYGSGEAAERSSHGTAARQSGGASISVVGKVWLSLGAALL
jgi:hypothetical protein